MALHVGSISHQKSVERLPNRQTPSDPRRYLWGTGGSLLVTLSPPAFQNTLTNTLTVSVRKVFETQLRLLRSSAASGRRNRQARADNRGGQGVLHGAGVEDAHNVAGEGRRKRGEERPVQPVLTVQLDDLCKHPRKSQ